MMCGVTEPVGPYFPPLPPLPPPQYGPPQYGPPQYGPPQYGPPQYGAPQAYGVGYPFTPAPVRPRRRGRTAAIIVASVGGVLLLGRLLDVASTKMGPHKPAVGSTNVSNVSYSAVAMGDCLAEFSPGSSIKTVPLIRCELPHAAEVFYVSTMSGTTYPGKEAVLAEADAICKGPQLGAFVGDGEATVTGRRVGYLYPTDSSWLLGNHTIKCMVLAPRGGTLIGSARGTGQ